MTKIFQLMIFCVQFNFLIYTTSEVIMQLRKISVFFFFTAKIFYLNNIRENVFVYILKKNFVKKPYFEKFC